MAIAEITQSERLFPPSSSVSELLSELTGRERYSSRAGATKPEVVPTVVTVPSRGKTVQFNYLDHGEPEPSWFAPVLHGFANLVTLSDNWDGEGAKRIDSAAINRALAAIEQLLPHDAPAPSIVPVPNSGLQIEWHRNGKDLEVEFNPNGSVEFYYYDEGTEEESEGPVGAGFSNVRDLLQRVW
ncbi:MAG TPA: hypothetical protein VMM76_18150 [Pirellulaceae bacterium]|nr:hypothetical protein [Pirellulaceae bacterium]